MNQRLNIYTYFYAVSLATFGLQQFITGTLIAGRPLSWPGWLPAEQFTAYITGAIFIATPLFILLKKKPVYGLLAVASIILLWAGLRNVYYIILHLDYGAMLTNTGKALTIGSGALVVAALFTENMNTDLSKRIYKGSFICQYFTGFFLLASGAQHFLFADFVKQLVPAWIPGSLFWTYLQEQPSWPQD
jgi:hypothetical protein